MLLACRENQDCAGVPPLWSFSGVLGFILMSNLLVFNAIEWYEEYKDNQ